MQLLAVQGDARGDRERALSRSCSPKSQQRMHMYVHGKGSVRGRWEGTEVGCVIVSLRESLIALQVHALDGGSGQITQINRIRSAFLSKHALAYRTELTCGRRGKPSEETQEQQLIQHRLEQRHPVYPGGGGPGAIHMFDRHGSGRDGRIATAAAAIATSPPGFCCCCLPSLELLERLYLSAHKIILRQISKRASRAKTPAPLVRISPPASSNVSPYPPPASAEVDSSLLHGSSFSSPEIGGLYGWVLPSPVGTLARKQQVTAVCSFLRHKGLAKCKSCTRLKVLKLLQMCCICGVAPLRFIHH